MSNKRYVKSATTPCSLEQIQNAVNNFYAQNGFKPYTYNNELWYKKGVGYLMTNPQFIRFIIEENKITVEAFTKYAIIPGSYAGEFSLDSVMGLVPNEQLKRKIDELFISLNATIIAPQPPQPAPQQMPQQPPQYQAQPQQTVVQPQPVVQQQTTQSQEQPVIQEQPNAQQPVIQEQTIAQPQPVVQQAVAVQQQEAQAQFDDDEAEYCPFCGAKAVPNALFCKKCGKKIN